MGFFISGQTNHLINCPIIPYQFISTSKFVTLIIPLVTKKYFQCEKIIFGNKKGGDIIPFRI
jgi:hypothetical protein